MSDRSAIEWTDASWNPVRARVSGGEPGSADTGRLGWHCEHVSEGCRNCYAESFNRRLGTKLDYKPGHRKDIDLYLDEKALLAPLRWRKPRKIFVCSMTDLFADFVPDEWIDRMFAVMALCPQHVFQVLTKRPERMREYLTTPADHDGRGRELNVYEQWRLMREGWRKFAPWDREWDWQFRSAQGLGSCNPDWPLPNVWLGVSVEDQAAADERIPHLLATPAAVRWLSCEPLLGPIDLNNLCPVHHPQKGDPNPFTGRCVWPGAKGFEDSINATSDRTGKIHWVVVGGESGPGARPMHPDWARSLRDQCAAAGVPFLFKQWGAWAPGEVAGDFLDADKAAKGVSLFDGSWDECWSEPDGHRDDEPDLYRIGKGKAGRLLDGVEHNGYPA